MIFYLPEIDELVVIQLHTVDLSINRTHFNVVSDKGEECTNYAWYFVGHL